MPPPKMISLIQLSRLIGQPDAPVLIDVRSDEDHALDGGTLPGWSRDATEETHNWPVGHVSSGPARDKTR